MGLAYITVPGRGRTDDLVAEVVRTFVDDGLRLAGTVCARPPDPLEHPCEMDLRVLPDGPGFRISQRLGPMAKGCRLDAGVIETIASAVEARLPGADLLIVNKFGRREAHGRGLYPAIAMAIEMGIPTLVGVNKMSIPAFNSLSGDMAEPLPPELCAVRRWYERMQRSLGPVAV